MFWQVSEGYRRPIPEDWPEDIRRLVADCWAAQAMERPPMRQVAMRLANFLASAELEVRPGLAGWPDVSGIRVLGFATRLADFLASAELEVRPVGWCSHLV